MMRVIPGASSQTGLRLLVITDNADPPTVVVGGNPGGVTYDISKALQTTPEQARYLNVNGRPLCLFVVLIGGLGPGTRYTVVVDHSTWAPQTIRFTTLPNSLPAEGLTVAIASCFYDGFQGADRYVAGLRALTGPFAPHAFKLLVGDNLYLDVTADQSKYTDGYEETAAHYRRALFSSDYHAALALSPNFTTWDDHEFWNNFPEVQFFLSRSQAPLRSSYFNAGHECLDLFQQSLNPGGIQATRSYTFDAGGVSFFVADTRTRRTLAGVSSPRFMPANELGDLQAWAAGLRIPGVLVLGQPLWHGAGGYTDYNLPDFERQYQALWTALATAPYDIMVVSGDVHHSRLLELSVPNGGRFIYEFVSSPASHIPTVASSIWRKVFGGPGKQGTSEVEFPAQVPMRSGGNPRLSRYLFGAGANITNTIGLLCFKPGIGTSVDVGCAILDLDTRLPAISEEANIDGGRKGAEKPKLGRNGTCLSERAFTLGKRP